MRFWLNYFLILTLATCQSYADDFDWNVESDQYPTDNSAAQPWQDPDSDNNTSANEYDNSIIEVPNTDEALLEQENKNDEIEEVDFFQELYQPLKPTKQPEGFAALQPYSKSAEKTVLQPSGINPALPISK